MAWHYELKPPVTLECRHKSGLLKPTIALALPANAGSEILAKTAQNNALIREKQTLERSLGDLTDSVIMRGEPQFIRIITTIKLPKGKGWELQFKRLCIK